MVRIKKDEAGLVSLDVHFTRRIKKHVKKMKGG